MAIIFVTGVSTAGKTTVYETLRKDPDLADVEFHDIDEDGVPPAGRSPWRQFRVEQLLHEAVERHNSQGTPTVICGISKPHEVIESQAWTYLIPIHFILLDISVPILTKRLRARLEGHASEADIVATIQGNRLLSEVLRKSVENQRNGAIANLNGGRFSKLQLRRRVKHMIEELLPLTIGGTL